MAKYSVKNIVVSVNLNTPIPLEKLAAELPNVEYNTEQFPGLIYRSKDATLLIFNSGKVNVTGSKSVKGVKEIIERFRKTLEKIGIKTPNKYDINVQNYVISGEFEVGGEIDLLRLVEELDNVEYNPEQFPGAIVKFDNVTFLVFRAGKFVCTGAKSDEEAEEKIKKFEELIKQFVKTKK